MGGPAPTVFADFATAAGGDGEPAQVPVPVGVIV